MTEAPNQASSKAKSKRKVADTTPSITTPDYQAAYERLSQIATELENGPIDLDQALPLLTEAQAAYAICQERIERLQLLLVSNSQDAAKKISANEMTDE